MPLAASPQAQRLIADRVQACYDRQSAVVQRLNANRAREKQRGLVFLAVPVAGLGLMQVASPAVALHAVQVSAAMLGLEVARKTFGRARYQEQLRRGYAADSTWAGVQRRLVAWSDAPAGPERANAEDALWSSLEACSSSRWAN
jgi:hypothetical protein